MRRLGLFLLLASCSYDRVSHDAPHWDVEPIPRDIGLDAGRDAARPRLDASRPRLDAAAPRDAGAPPPCNPEGCGLLAQSCITDDDCCQPSNFPRGFVSCLNNQCSSASVVEPTQWDPALPFCLGDGGAPPPGEGVSSLTRCNAASCKPELAPCTSDEDCCQPSNQPYSFAICPAARRFCMIVNRMNVPPAPQCLPDGGLPEILDAGFLCRPRGERCNFDTDCCQEPNGLPPTVCIGGFCDKHAF